VVKNIHAYEPFSADLMARVRLSSNINALQLAFARCAKMGCPIILMIFKELHGTAENGSEA